MNSRFARDGRSCRGWLLAMVWLGLAWSPALGKTPPLSDAFVKLRSVQSPDQLVFSRLPPQYTVPVTLSGDIADEMERTMRTINLEAPKYLEVLDKKHLFHLLLANRNYSLETRDLLSGVLNPAEMMDIVVSSALKYRQEDQFRAIADETIITCTPGIFGDKKILTFVLVPKGKYFAYSYEDMGAYVRESWLTSLVCVIDSASRCVYGLTLHKNSRIFAADQTQKPPVDSSVLHYAFTYGVFDAVFLPAGLTLSINGCPSLTLTASYRWDGSYVVFDTRKICYVNPAKPSAEPRCLMMTYGIYELNAVPPSFGQALQPGRYAQNLEKAARLARTALERIRSGNIDAAVGVLRRVVSDFPETPQAVEARELLSSLPGGADAH